MTETATPTIDITEPGYPAGGDTHYWQEPIEKWKEMTNFVVPYTDASNYWQPVERERPIVLDAVAKAAEFFSKLGALYPITFEDDAITIHLHPRTGQLVFIFKRQIAGAVHECGIPYMLSPDQIGWLKATGRWPEKKRKGENVH